MSVCVCVCVCVFFTEFTLARPFWSRDISRVCLGAGNGPCMRKITSLPGHTSCRKLRIGVVQGECYRTTLSLHEQVLRGRVCLREEPAQLVARIVWVA